MSPVVNGRDGWRDILADPPRMRKPVVYTETAAARGLQVRHRASGFTGILTRVERDGVVLTGPNGNERIFRMARGAFDVDGRTVTLVVPTARPSAPAVTASGSTAVVGAPAKVARASRILVEGIHDAQLVERVWGDDLRVAGVVVERLDGIDHLATVVADFAPGPGRRLGVLVDHLLPGTKEARMAAELDDDDVLVTGTPFVDVWQAVKPAVVGIPAWPDVPRGKDWKLGVCQRLAIADPTAMWRRILASVRSYADLDAALVGAVEQLIDFVTEPPGP